MVQQGQNPSYLDLGEVVHSEEDNLTFDSGLPPELKRLFSDPNEKEPVSLRSRAEAPVFVLNPFTGETYQQSINRLRRDELVIVNQDGQLTLLGTFFMIGEGRLTPNTMLPQEVELLSRLDPPLDVLTLYDTLMAHRGTLLYAECPDVKHLKNTPLKLSIDLRKKSTLRPTPTEYGTRLSLVPIQAPAPVSLSEDNNDIYFEGIISLEDLRNGKRELDPRYGRFKVVSEPEDGSDYLYLLEGKRSQIKPFRTRWVPVAEGLDNLEKHFI